jgi:hypothetical protein
MPRYPEYVPPEIPVIEEYNGYVVGDKVKWNINSVDVGEGVIQSFGTEGVAILFNAVTDTGLELVGFATTITEKIADQQESV